MEVHWSDVIEYYESLNDNSSAETIVDLFLLNSINFLISASRRKIVIMRISVYYHYKSLKNKSQWFTTELDNLKAWVM